MADGQTFVGYEKYNVKTLSTITIRKLKCDLNQNYISLLTNNVLYNLSIIKSNPCDLTVGMQ